MKIKTFRIKGICHVLLLMYIFASSISPASADLQKPGSKERKQLAPWIVYDKEKTFDRISGAADILSSLSVFGKPPREFIERCHRLNIEVYKAVGGDESAITTPERLQGTINGYMKTCREEGYDGIDLDFEHLSPDCRDKYSEFLKKLSQALHSSGKKLSQCVGFYDRLYRDPNKKDFLDHRLVGETCDLVRLMVYDMYFAPDRCPGKLKDWQDSSGIGPTSSYPFARTMVKYWLGEVPREKVIMGLPAYSNDYVMGVYPDCAGAQVYRSRPEIPEGTSFQRSWLWFEKLNTYTYLDARGSLHLFYASDAASTCALLDVADEMNVAGIGFWHFSSVDSETWDAVRQWLGRQP